MFRSANVKRGGLLISSGSRRIFCEKYVAGAYQVTAEPGGSQSENLPV